MIMKAKAYDRAFTIVSLCNILHVLLLEWWGEAPFAGVPPLFHLTLPSGT